MSFRRITVRSVPPHQCRLGQACAAIDAAAPLLKHIHTSVGTETTESAWVIEAADVVCQVYWRG
jgi:hypothetical protein